MADILQSALLAIVVAPIAMILAAGVWAYAATMTRELLLPVGRCLVIELWRAAPLTESQARAFGGCMNAAMVMASWAGVIAGCAVMALEAAPHVAVCVILAGALARIALARMTVRRLDRSRASGGWGLDGASRARVW